jgi:hypothetical protein
MLGHPQQLYPGIVSGRTQSNNQLIPGGIPACGRDGERCCGVGNPEDAVGDVAQVPHVSAGLLPAQEKKYQDDSKIGKQIQETMWAVESWPEKKKKSLENATLGRELSALGESGD